MVDVRRTDNSEPGFKRYAVSVLFGSLAGFALGLVLLLPVSALILAGVLDEGMSGILLVVIVFAGALLGGVFASGKARARQIMIGLITGLVQFLWLCVAGLLLYDRFIPSKNGLALLLASAAGGLLGGRIMSSSKGAASRRRK